MTYKNLSLISLSTLAILALNSCGVSKKEGKESQKKIQYVSFNTSAAKVENTNKPTIQNDAFPISFIINCPELKFTDKNYEVIPGENQKSKIQLPLNTSCTVNIEHVKLDNNIYKPKLIFTFTPTRIDKTDKLKLNLPNEQFAFIEEKGEKSLFLIAKQNDNKLEFYYSANLLSLDALFTPDNISNHGIAVENEKIMDVSEAQLKVIYAEFNGEPVYTIVRNKDRFKFWDSCKFIQTTQADTHIKSKKPTVDQLKSAYDNIKGTPCNKINWDEKNNWKENIKDEYFFIFKHEGKNQTEYDAIRVGNEDEIKLYNKLSGITNGSENPPTPKEGLENIKKNISEFKKFVKENNIEKTIKEHNLTDYFEKKIAEMEEIAQKKHSTGEIDKAIKKIEAIKEDLMKKINEG